MSVRDELAAIISEACRPWGDGLSDAYRSADRVLTYLGNLDPDCDPELVAAHLKADRARIAELTADNLALIDLLGDTDD